MSTPPATGPDTIAVLAILPPGQETEMIRRVLAEEDITATLRDPTKGTEVWENGESCGAVIVDESLEPAAIAEALERGWIRRTAPLFVLTRRLPDRERYIAWLEAGAWDIVKMPLESMALALRLRNVLRGQRQVEGQQRAAARYRRDALVRVADETIALAHRQGRSLQCAAVALDLAGAGGEGTDRPDQAVLERLADATQRLVRRSDLIGVGDGILFVLLPDTEPKGARTFVERLREFLDERLVSWGLTGTVRTGIASAKDITSGRELLSAASRDL